MSASSPVIVTKQFSDDFEAVCARYEVPDDEREEMRQAARRDLENAIPCFAALARESA